VPQCFAAAFFFPYPATPYNIVPAAGGELFRLLLWGRPALPALFCGKEPLCFMNIQKQTRRLSAFGFASCLRISDAVWVVLLAARGFPLWQIGLAEGVFHLVSLIGEIPSGMAADLLGRRRSLAVSGLCGVLSALVMAFSTNYLHICISMAFSALSCNFLSGSDEALLYDSLKQAGQEEHYLKASARYVQWQNVGYFFSNAASVLTGLLRFTGFYLTDAAICVTRIAAALSLTEPVVTDTQAARQQNPFAGLGRRLWEHMATAVSFLRSDKRVLPVILADGLIGLPSYLTLMFLQQRLNGLGVPTVWLGLPVMLFTASRMAGVALGEKLPRIGMRRLFVVTALFVGFGTLCAGLCPVLPAVLGGMLAAGAMDLWILHQQRYLNDLFPSDQRATLISVNAMSYSLLMVAASPLTGWVGDVTGNAGAGLCLLGGLLLAAAGAAALLKSRNAG